MTEPLQMQTSQATADTEDSLLEKIFVEGRLQVRQYDSKQNGKEVSVEIIPSTVRFLGSGRTEVAERPTPGKPSAGTRDASNGADGTDEDVPQRRDLDQGAGGSGHPDGAGAGRHELDGIQGASCLSL